MIIDAFLFRNEFTCLDIRLNELDGQVDQHLLVEANWTFQGEPKPHSFTRMVDSTPNYPLSRWPIVVKRLTGDPYPSGSTWAREAAMRESILEALADQPDDAYVILGDADEVPAGDAIQNAIAVLNHRNVKDSGYVEPSVAFSQQQRFYFLDNLVTGMDRYPGSQVMTLATLRRNGVQRMRDNRWKAPDISDGGWHFCNLGDVADFIEKLQSFAHEELNTPENTDPEFVADLIESRKVLGDRQGKYKSVIEPRWLPAWVMSNRKLLKPYLYSEMVKEPA